MSKSNTGGFSPCPGCGGVGFTIAVWKGERKPENELMQCSNGSCRVDQYEKIMDGDADE